MSSGSAVLSSARPSVRGAPTSVPQLAVHVDPFADAHVVQVLRPAQPPEGARPERRLLLLQVVPEVQQGQEVAGRVGESRVQPVCLLAALLRTLAHVLDRHARDDREDVALHAECAWTR